MMVITNVMNDGSILYKTMAKRYTMTYKFFNTEERAKIFCDNENLNNYIRKNHKAHYTPWSSQDGTENAYVAWYATR